MLYISCMDRCHIQKTNEKSEEKEEEEEKEKEEQEQEEKYRNTASSPHRNSQE